MDKILQLLQLHKMLIERPDLKNLRAKVESAIAAVEADAAPPAPAPTPEPIEVVAGNPATSPVKAVPSDQLERKV